MDCGVSSYKGHMKRILHDPSKFWVDDDGTDQSQGCYCCYWARQKQHMVDCSSVARVRGIK